MITNFTPEGVCAKGISFDLTDGKVTNVVFTGGCNGNLKGISALINGMDATDIIERVKGTTCNNRCTSCPDQLAKALEQSLAK